MKKNYDFKSPIILLIFFLSFEFNFIKSNVLSIFKHNSKSLISKLSSYDFNIFINISSLLFNIK